MIRKRRFAYVLFFSGDGLRQRLYAVLPSLRLKVELDRDAFAALQPVVTDKNLKRLRFTLENRTADAHSTSLKITNTAKTSYSILQNGKKVGTAKPGAESVTLNVKRLRPVELGPFDYENPPQTSSLWISEGLTTYFGDLMVIRAGLGTAQDFLSSLSTNIGQLQTSPGRLAQTLDQSSLDVWNSGTSGVGRDTVTKVSYYVKGPVVGSLLDAKIQRSTEGKKNLGDVMRLAYTRYSKARGFTSEQFRKTTE